MLASCSSSVGTATSPQPAGASSSPDALDSPFFDGDTARLEVGDEVLVVAIADTSAERAQGLRRAADLGGLDGMLFIHDGVGMVQYTMEDTTIPLDIWFIDAGGTVVGTMEMEPCETRPCPSYPSPAPVLQVLETELGRYDFAIGDRVIVD